MPHSTPPSPRPAVGCSLAPSPQTLVPPLAHRFHSPPRATATWCAILLSASEPSQRIMADAFTDSKQAMKNQRNAGTAPGSLSAPHRVSGLPGSPGTVRALRTRPARAADFLPFLPFCLSFAPAPLYRTLGRIYVPPRPRSGRPSGQGQAGKPPHGPWPFRLARLRRIPDPRSRNVWGFLHELFSRVRMGFPPAVAVSPLTFHLSLPSASVRAVIRVAPRQGSSPDPAHRRITSSRSYVPLRAARPNHTPAQSFAPRAARGGTRSRVE
jgi:hypothetical protein